MNIKLQCQTTSGHLSWEYNCELPTANMAIEYARSHAKSFACCEWFMGLLVWDMDRPRLLAEIKLQEPETVAKLNDEVVL
jgi:hypothetical protein